MILSEHLVHCDTDGMDFKTAWYMWTVGRLQQVFMMVSNKNRNILDNDLYSSLKVSIFVILKYLLNFSIMNRWKNIAQH